MKDIEQILRLVADFDSFVNGDKEDADDRDEIGMDQLDLVFAAAKQPVAPKTDKE